MDSRGPDHSAGGLVAVARDPTGGTPGAFSAAAPVARIDRNGRNAGAHAMVAGVVAHDRGSAGDFRARGTHSRRNREAARKRAAGAVRGQWLDGGACVGRPRSGDFGCADKCGTRRPRGRRCADRLSECAARQFARCRRSVACGPRSFGGAMAPEPRPRDCGAGENAFLLCAANSVVQRQPRLRGRR